MTTSTPGQMLTPNGQSYKWFYPGWKLYKPYKPKPTMLTKDQQRARSRNYLRYKVIRNLDTNVSLDAVKDGIVTEGEYVELQEINKLRYRLQQARILFLSKYRDNCDILNVPRPPERKPVTDDIISKLEDLF